jgi:hypothetical protein
MAHHVIDIFYNKIQGGFEHLAHSFVIRDSIFTTANVKKLGMHLLMVFIHSRTAEVLP